MDGTTILDMFEKAAIAAVTIPLGYGLWKFVGKRLDERHQDVLRAERNLEKWKVPPSPENAQRENLARKVAPQL